MTEEEKKAVALIREVGFTDYVDALTDEEVLALARQIADLVKPTSEPVR